MTMPQNRARASRSRRTRAATGFVHIVLLVLFVLGVTTFGVISTQSRVLERKSQQTNATARALDEAKRGLLDFAEGQGLEPYSVQAGRLPPLDFLSVYGGGERNNIRKHVQGVVVSRPGQLPCPDSTGTSVSPSTTPESARLKSYLDGNLDGVADYPFPTGVQELFGCHSLQYLGPSVSAAPLRNGTRLGRLPWREYFDLFQVSRGVSAGQSLDGNQDRLWYSVSHNLVDTSRPLNRHSLYRQNENWLTVVVTAVTLAGGLTSPVGSTTNSNQLATELTLTNVAAVAISPGRPNPTNTTVRPSEILANSAGDSAVADSGNVVTLYLEPDNADLDDTFTHSIGDIPDYADQIAYITSAEIITSMRKAERTSTMANLDRVADALDAYLARNHHLPEPATFDAANTEYVYRRLGYAAALNFRHTSPYLNFRVTTTLSPVLQGGRIDPAVGRLAISPGPSGVIAFAGVPSGLGVHGTLPATAMPDILVNQFNAPIANTPLTQPRSSLPPFSYGFTPGGVIAQASSNKVNHSAIIPAGTPVRAARAFYTHQDDDSDPYRVDNGTSSPYTDILGAFHDSGGSGLVLTTSSNGNAGQLSGQYNTLFADFRPGLFHRLTNSGYAAKLPAGTWLVATVDITIYGDGTRQSLDASNRLLSHSQFAYRPHLDDTSYVAYGTIDGTPVTATLTTGTGEWRYTPQASIPAKTPLVPGSQGLLPVGFLPQQLLALDPSILQSPHQDGPLSRERGSLIGAPRLLYPVISGNSRRNSRHNAIVTDPGGAFGSFPAEVTMASLGRGRIQINGTVTNDNEPFPLQQSLRNVSSRTQAIPYPIVSGNSAIVPGAIDVGGLITFPAGSKIHYKSGYDIPIGQNAFNHGHPDLIRRNALYGYAIGASNPTFRLTAHLSPGAVLTDVSVSANTILPDGSVAAANTLFARVTLVNGGLLAFDQLLHYTDGDYTLLPKTAAQRAYRIEAMGLGLINQADIVSLTLTNNPTNDQVVSLFLNRVTAIDNRNADLSGNRKYIHGNQLFLAASGAMPEFASNAFNNGYHLYPYHSVYEQRSIFLPKLFVPDTYVAAATIPPVPYHATAVSLATLNGGALLQGNLENLLSRADFWLYNVGAMAGPDVVLARQARLTNFLGAVDVPSYALIDSWGLPLEEVDQSATAYTVPTVPFPIIAGTDITLSLDRGIRMHANPSRMRIFYDHANTAPPTSARLGFAQYGSAAQTTPLVLPSVPDHLVPLLQTLTVPRNATLSTIMASGAEVAVRLSANNDIHDVDFSTDDNYVDLGTGRQPASDEVDLGTNMLTSKRAILKLNSDALFEANPSLSRKDAPVIPAGSRIEYGWLEHVSHSDLGGVASRSTHFLPGARLFDGVGFYPIPSGTGVHLNSDASSFAGPNLLTLRIEGAVNLRAADGIPIVIPPPASGVYTTVTLSGPRMLLPGGVDIRKWTVLDLSAAPCTNVGWCLELGQFNSLFHADTISFQDTDYPNSLLEGAGSTRVIVVAGTATESLADIDFQFVVNRGGAVTYPAPSETVTADTIQPGQVLRLRAVTDQQLVAISLDPATSASIFPPNVLTHALFELSWSGRDGHMGYGDLDPTTKVFAQNHPLFYAVAETCRNGIDTRPTGDCTAATKGLEVRVPPGDDVRLPSDQVAPAGLVIHSFRAPDSTHQPLEILYNSGSSTLSVQAVRLGNDGRLLTYNLGGSNANEVVRGSEVPAALGSTVIIRPNNMGVLFQRETEAASSYFLSPPRDPEQRIGHTEPLTIIMGGFTGERISGAAYQVTIATAATLTLAADSTVRFSTDVDEVSIYLAPGSEASGEDLSGMHWAGGPYVNLKLSLSANAVLINRGTSLPTIIASGNVLTLDTDPASTENFLGPGTVVELPGSGYAMQGIFNGNASTVNIYLNNTSGGLVRIRNLPTISASGYVPTFFNGGTIVNAPRAIGNFVPSSHNIDPASLAVYGQATLSITQGTIAGACWLCQGTAVVDISGFATSSAIMTVASTMLTVYQYPSLVTTRATFHGSGSASHRQTGGVVTDMEIFGEADMTVEIDTSNHNEASITLSIAHDSATPLPFADRDLSLWPPAPITITNAYAGNAFRLGGTNNSRQDYYDLTRMISLSFSLTSLPPNLGIAIDRMGTGQQTFRLTVGLTPGAYEFPPELDMALFFNPIFPVGSNNRFPFVTDGRAFTNSLSAQLYVTDSNIGLNFSASNMELGLQIPSAVTLADGTLIHAGSIIYPDSGRLLNARSFQATRPFSITLGSSGGVASVVGGGGIGEAVRHRRAAAAREDITGARTAIDTSNLTVVANNVSLNIVGNTSFTKVFSPRPRNLATDPSVADHVLYYTHPELTITDLDTRQAGAVLLRDSVNGVPIPVSQATGFLPVNLLPAARVEFLPLLHGISLAAGAVMEIRPSPLLAQGDWGDYVLPANSTLHYFATSVTVDIAVSGMTVPLELPGGNSFAFANGPTLRLRDGVVDFEEFLPLNSSDFEDHSVLTTPLRQNMWIQIGDEITVTEPLTGQDLVLPANTVINPILGTYLQSQFSSPVDDLDSIRLNTDSTAELEVPLAFAPPALILPAGLTLNAGNVTLTFTDVKAVISHSPTPLLDVRIPCGKVDYSDVTPELISQLHENVTEFTRSALPYTPEYTLNQGIPSRPFLTSADVTVNVNMGDRHPCLFLDVPENYDLDRTFVYTSGMLIDDPYLVATTPLQRSALRVNDRMRIIGGKLAP